jgi:hypothetical protein
MLNEKQISDELDKIPIAKNKSYADWITYFMENGVQYELAKAMARSKCFELNSEVNINEFRNRW